MGNFAQLWARQAVLGIPCPVAIPAFIQTRIEHPLWADELEKGGSSGHTARGTALWKENCAPPSEGTKRA